MDNLINKLMGLDPNVVSNCCYGAGAGAMVLGAPLSVPIATVLAVIGTVSQMCANQEEAPVFQKTSELTTPAEVKAKAEEAATELQAGFRGKQGRAKAAEARAKAAEAKAENWESLQDEAGQTYYSNTVTNKTMWERPEAIAQAQVTTNLQARVRGNQARAEVKEILSEARKIYPQKLRRVKFSDEVRAEAKNLRRDEFLDEVRAEKALKRRENFIKETDKGYAEQEPMRATDFEGV